MKTNAIVVDIDNTVINTRPIFEEIYGRGLVGDAMWEYFDNNCTRDDLQVINPIKDLINLYYDFEYEVIFLSARSHEVARKTKDMLDKIFNTSVFLITRDINDYRPSADIKHDKLVKLLDTYDIRLFIDDESSNCQAAKALGILTLKIF